ncbi:hypothetical protein [Streptomyces phaeochromogenes]
MDEGDGADLIRLTDSDSSVRVRVLGRISPGDGPYNDYLDGDGWVDELREQLASVRLMWPNEVVTTPRSGNYWQ